MAKHNTPSSAVHIGPKAVRTSSPSLSQLNLEPGTVLFDQWKIRRERRRGGHGVVFEAEEILLRETQAVKILDPALMVRSDMLERFRSEVSLMRGFSHPHILKVFDYREDTERQLALISMEYVEGGTVRDLLDLARQRQARIPLVLALRILFQALDALAEAHAKKIVHRDVAPGNILLAGGSSQDLLRDPLRDPGVKLLDFGIAGLVDKIHRSQEGEGLGTASYAAPEALHPEEKVTPATDIYGLGAVVWELTTGHFPTVSSPRPSDCHQDAPKELDTLLLHLLDTEATRRPDSESARARAADLLEQVSGVPMEEWAVASGARSTSTRVSSASTRTSASTGGLRFPVSLNTVRHPAFRWGVGLATTFALVMVLMTRLISGGPAGPPPEEYPDLGVPPPPVQPPEAQPSAVEPPEAGAQARPPGVYLKADRAAGTRLMADLVEPVASRGEPVDDRPLDFEAHLRGACLNRAMTTGARLEWGDLEPCG